MTNNVVNEVHAAKADTSHLIKLIEQLEPFLEFEKMPVNTRLTHFGSSSHHKCYLIKSGIISLHRQPDDILIELCEAPTLRGIAKLKSTTDLLVFKVLVPSEIAVIERQKLFELISEHNLWEHFAMHHLEVLSVALEKIVKLSTPKAYDLIRNQLYELINLSATTRESILVEEYIRGKTRMSRSGVMRILSDLKEAGYIVIERGILKEVRHLPKKY